MAHPRGARTCKFVLSGSVEPAPEGKMSMSSGGRGGRRRPLCPRPVARPLAEPGPRRAKQRREAPLPPEGRARGGQRVRRRRHAPPDTQKPPCGGSCAAGGEGGIRTHGRLTPTPDFESGTFDHSATSPMVSPLRTAEGAQMIRGAMVAAQVVPAGFRRMVASRPPDHDDSVTALESHGTMRPA